jgi:hypothetical protein
LYLSSLPSFPFVTYLPSFLPAGKRVRKKKGGGERRRGGEEEEEEEEETDKEKDEEESTGKSERGK